MPTGFISCRASIAGSQNFFLSILEPLPRQRLFRIAMTGKLPNSSATTAQENNHPSPTAPTPAPRQPQGGLCEAGESSIPLLGATKKPWNKPGLEGKTTNRLSKAF